MYAYWFQVTRICDVISNSSSQNLPNCDLTSRECVTYSRNKLYVYKCQENGISQQKHGKCDNKPVFIGGTY